MVRDDEHSLSPLADNNARTTRVDALARREDFNLNLLDLVAGLASVGRCIDERRLEVNSVCSQLRQVRDVLDARRVERVGVENDLFAAFEQRARAEASAQNRDEL